VLHPYEGGEVRPTRGTVPPVNLWVPPRAAAWLWLELPTTLCAGEDCTDFWGGELSPFPLHRLWFPDIITCHFSSIPES